MIFLVRHGETVWNTEFRRQGRGDSALTQRGIAQSEAVGQFLREQLPRGEHIHIISSPAGRSRRTAAIIAQAMGRDPGGVKVSNLLEEMDFGDWQGLTDTEIAEQFPEQWRERQLNRWSFTYPRGESYPTLCSRVASWMETAQAESGHIVAITHQWTSRAIRGQYLQLPKQEMFEVMHPHAQVVQLLDGQEQVYQVPVAGA